MTGCYINKDSNIENSTEVYQYHECLNIPGIATINFHIQDQMHDGRMRMWENEDQEPKAFPTADFLDAFKTVFLPGSHRLINNPVHLHVAGSSDEIEIIYYAMRDLFAEFRNSQMAAKSVP